MARVNLNKVENFMTILPQHRGEESASIKMSTYLTLYRGSFNKYVDKMRGRMGSKKWQKSVHVVVECPLSKNHYTMCIFIILIHS